MRRREPHVITVAEADRAMDQEMVIASSSGYGRSKRLSFNPHHKRYTVTFNGVETTYKRLWEAVPVYSRNEYAE